MRIKVFHTPKPRQFEYKPLHYDPAKEEDLRRASELRGARPAEGEYVPGSILRSQFNARNEAAEQARKARRGKGGRLAVMIVLAAALAALIFIR